MMNKNQCSQLLKLQNKVSTVTLSSVVVVSANHPNKRNYLIKSSMCIHLNVYNTSHWSMVFLLPLQERRPMVLKWGRVLEVFLPWVKNCCAVLVQIMPLKGLTLSFFKWCALGGALTARAAHGRHKCLSSIVSIVINLKFHILAPTH